MPSSFAWSQYKTTGKPIPGAQVCPTWAGGDGVTVYDTATELTIDHGAAPPPPAPPGLDSSWTQLKYTLGTDGSSIVADLAPLNGSVPTAIRYAWGIIDCNDYSDPDLWVTVSAAAAHSYHVVIPCPCVRSVLAERQNCVVLDTRPRFVLCAAWLRGELSDHVLFGAACEPVHGKNRWREVRLRGPAGLLIFRLTLGCRMDAPLCVWRRMALTKKSDTKVTRSIRFCKILNLWPLSWLVLRAACYARCAVTAQQPSSQRPSLLPPPQAAASPENTSNLSEIRPIKSSTVVLGSGSACQCVRTSCPRPITSSASSWSISASV